MTDEIQKHGGVAGDIDLVELVRGLWEEKWIVLIFSLLGILFAAIYAFLSTPVYEARIAILPPSLSDVAGFNQGRTRETGLGPFKVQDVYSVFVRNLQADGTRHRFFNETYLPSLDEELRSVSRDALYKRFTDQISISLPGKDFPGRYLVAIEQEDPERAASWVRWYIADAAEISIQEMLNNAHREIEVKARDIEQRIQNLRENAKARREDRIVQLKEALKVAGALKLEEPPLISGQSSEELSAIMNGSLMYMRGSKAIMAEIQTLEARSSDDPFIPALRTLQEQQLLLSSLRVNSERVSVFRQDGPIETPDSPVRPRRAMILIFGLIIGGVLGGFLALCRIFLKKYAR